MSEQNETNTLRYLVESAIRVHSLECSKKYRAGKFERVGEDFLNEVRADVEQLLREIENKFQTLHPALAQGSEGDPQIQFTTGLLSARVDDILNRAIARLIQNKVQKQPTVGKTLSRTR